MVDGAEFLNILNGLIFMQIIIQFGLFATIWFSLIKYLFIYFYDSLPFVSLSIDLSLFPDHWVTWQLLVQSEEQMTETLFEEMTWYQNKWTLSTKIDCIKQTRNR